jgi:hypothetical protein
LGPNKKPAPKDGPPKGLLSSVSRIFGFGPKPNAADIATPMEKTENGNNGQDVAGTEGENVDLGRLLRLEDRTVADDSQAATKASDDGSDGQEITEEEGVNPDRPTPSGPTKRKRDIYDVDQAHIEKVEKGGGVVARTKLKQPAKKQAKSPLVPPMKSPAVTTQRQTRAKARVAYKEPEIEMIPRRSNSFVSSGSGQVSEPTKKRRGRPRKNQLVLPEPSNDMPEPFSAEAADGVDNGIQAPAAEDGVADILMNPSPVRPIPSGRRSLKSSKRLQNPPSLPVNGGSSNRRLSSADRLQDPGSCPRSTELWPVSDAEEGSDKEEAAPNGSAPDFPEVEDDQIDEVSKTLKDIISIKDLEEMYEITREVGQKRDKKTGELKKVQTHDSPYSTPGKIMMRRLEGLIKAYRAMGASKRAGSDNTATLQSQIDKMTGVLMEQAEVVFTKRLGNPAHGIPFADENLTRSMLTDIYFFLVPSLVAVVKTVLEAYQDEEVSKTEALKEIVNLLDLLKNLGEGALRQPKASQPTANKNNQYRTKSPTKSILPTIRLTHRTLATELRRRELIEKTAAWNSGAVERERRRIEAEEHEYEGIRRRRAEIHRMQRAVLDAKLRHRFYGPSLQTEIEREEAKQAQKQAARASQSRYHRSSQRSSTRDLGQDEDIEDDPFDDQFERVSVFGSHNANNDGGPKPLSKYERALFIDIMRLEDSIVSILHFKRI